MTDQLAHLNLYTLTLVCLLGAMSPGPSLAVILGIAAQSGPSSAALASWAHAIGVGVWATLSLSGWSYLLTRAPEIAQWLTLIASLYLMHAVMSRALRTEWDDTDERITEVFVEGATNASLRISAADADDAEDAG